jgi:hypothetical protein
MPKKKQVPSTVRKIGSRKELDRETSKILRLKEQIAKNFWDLGACLCRVHDKKLYQATGYKFFEEYLAKEVKIGRSTAYRLMDLARNFSRETAIEFGQTKLLCAIDYAKATPEPDRPLDVTRYEIEVKTPSGKKVTKSFKQASTREIKRAAAQLFRQLKSGGPPALDTLPQRAMAGLLSGKTPKFRIAPFLSRAREKLKAFSPRPKVTLTVTKKGDDPLVDLRLSNVHASKLTGVFGLLTAAALEAWMESIQ